MRVSIWPNSYSQIRLQVTTSCELTALACPQDVLGLGEQLFQQLWKRRCEPLATLVTLSCSLLPSPKDTFVWYLSKGYPGIHESFTFILGRLWAIRDSASIWVYKLCLDLSVALGLAPASVLVQILSTFLLQTLFHPKSSSCSCPDVGVLPSERGWDTFLGSLSQDPLPPHSAIL